MSQDTQASNGESNDAASGAEPQEKVMSLYDHLDELRRRLVVSLLAILAVFVASMFFSNDLIKFLTRPLATALPQGSSTLHFTGPMDVFIAQLKVGGMVAIIFACPVWLFQVWKFIEPALYDHEKKYAFPFISSSMGLFFTGITFSFLIVIPMAMSFLIGIGTDAGATPIITVNDYISILTILVLGFGVVFQMPIIIILLALLDLVSLEFLVQYRKMMFIVILIVAAILTPPDPLSQMAMAVPMWLMYEISIIVIRIMQKGRKQKDAQAA